MVLYAALGSAFEERRYELAVIRALGARRELAAAGAPRRVRAGRRAGRPVRRLRVSGGGAVLAHEVFHFGMTPTLWPLGCGSQRRRAD